MEPGSRINTTAKVVWTVRTIVFNIFKCNYEIEYEIETNAITFFNLYNTNNLGTKKNKPKKS